MTRTLMPRSNAAQLAVLTPPGDPGEARCWANLGNALKLPAHQSSLTEARMTIPG
jgi:hypothetical protein